MTDYLAISICFLLSICTCKTNAQNNKPFDFLPEGYMLCQTQFADLNNDDQEDCILIIKATKEENIVINRFDEKVDRNRRGVIILFQKKKQYVLIDKNLDCFYSENEDGGNYYAPQLHVSAEMGDIIFYFEHGRYGAWSYRFRYMGHNFKLVKYEAITGGTIIDSETIIDFLTKEKLIRKNVNEEPEGNDEIYEKTKTTLKIDKLIQLSEIKDFEDLVP